MHNKIILKQDCVPKEIIDPTKHTEKEMLFEEDIASYIIPIIKNTSLILSKFRKANNGRCMKSLQINIH